MKLAFQAVDSNGRVLRGVLSATDPGEARELLLGEGIFPKTLEPCGDETKTTWAARPRRAARPADSDGAPGRSFPVTWSDGGTTRQGNVVLTRDGRVLLDDRQLDPAAIESVRFRGLLRRSLSIAFIDGALVEFPAGLILASPLHKKIAALLSSAPQSTPRKPAP